jgi:hypothetical protein
MCAVQRSANETARGIAKEGCQNIVEGQNIHELSLWSTGRGRTPWTVGMSPTLPAPFPFFCGKSPIAGENILIKEQEYHPDYKLNEFHLVLNGSRF